MCHRIKKSKCPICGIVLKSNKRKDGVFCSDFCRFQFHRTVSKSKKRCSVCGLEFILMVDSSVCFRCAWDDYAKKFQNENNDLINWLNENSVCFYCGEIATEKEHVLPRRTEIKSFIVPACRECNLIASGNVFDSIAEKMKFIKEKRAYKYKKVLSMPEWDAEEIRELGRNLRISVTVQQNAKEIIKEQLLWDPVAYFCME